VAEADVAPNAEESAHFVCLVIVVNVRGFVAEGFTADGASVSLRVE
jgi:hypothetical protein